MQILIQFVAQVWL